MPGGSTYAFDAGTDTNSANAPSRFTPMPFVLRQRWRRPARQLRQWPQVTCPSTETRWPFVNPWTSLPISTIVPSNSCPSTSGILIVRCAQASQFTMCRSVPQIEA